MEKKRTDKTDVKPEDGRSIKGKGGKGQSEKLLSSEERRSRKIRHNITLSEKNDERYSNKKYTVKRAAAVSSPVFTADDRSVHTFSQELTSDEKAKKQKKAAAVSQQLNDTSEKERMRKKAAYLKESMQQSVIASEYADRQSYNEYENNEFGYYENGSYYDSRISDEYSSERADLEEKRNTEKYSENYASAQSRSNEKHSREKFSENISSAIPEHKTVSEETAQRLKRAAYIKEMTERDISLSRILQAENEESEAVQEQTNSADETVDQGISEEKNVNFESRFLGNSQSAFDDDDFDKRHSAAVKQAYEKDILKKQNERRKQRAEMNSRLDTGSALLAAERAKAAADKSAAVQSGIRNTVVSSAQFAERGIEAVRSGNAARIISQPAAEILRKSVSENTNEFADNILTVSDTVQNSDSVGGAAANAGTALALSELKKAAGKSYLDRMEKSAEKSLERKYRYIDRKTEKKLKKIQEQRSESMNGEIGKQLENKLDKTERKQEEYKKKLAKQQKEIQRRQQKAIYIKHNRNNPSFAPNTAKGNGTARLPKKKKAALAGGAVTSIIPVFIIVIVVFIIAVFFSWLNPFDFVLAGSEENKKAETEEEILDTYILEIQNYMDAAQMRCWLTYGKYCNAHYGWDALVPDWDGYYKKFVEPQIEAVTKSIQESYRESLASSKGDSAVVASMVKAIQEAIAKIIEQARKDYQEILDGLNDIYGEPQEGKEIIHFDPPVNSKTEHTEPGGGKNEVWDVGEYNGKTCDGTNRFNLGSLNFDTDMSAEDMFTLLALSRTLDLINNSSGETPESEKKEFAEITTDEINDFFEKTEFIQIEAHLEKGTCNGRCRRRLKGDWDSGWSAEYFCTDPEKPDEDPRHNVLSGKITVKSKEEMIEAVMDKYNAEGAGMTRKDCDEAIKTYEKYIEEKLGKGNERQFGKNDTSRAKSFYDIESGGKGVPNIGIWRINTPLETDKDKEEEAKDDKKTA